MTKSPLMGALQGCSLHPLLMVTSQVLSRSGYGDVQILDRRQSKQRSRFGGHEIECITYLGDVRLKVVVKVIPDGVRLRMVDELVGTVQRRSADMGILVSTKTVARSAKTAVRTYGQTRVELIDGEALADLLTKYHIGLRSRGDVDYQYFECLEEAAVLIDQFRRERL